MSTAGMRVVGFLVSLAIHVSAAAIALPIALSLGRSVPQLSTGDVRDPDGGRVDAPSEGLISRQARLESSSPRDGRNVVQPIENLANSDQPDAGTWLNHLWQSTIFALAIGLLTIAFRRNHARVRYWLWFSSSVKFLIPFSMLATFGSRLPWPSTASTTAVAPVVSSTMAQVSQPFLEGGSSGFATALSTPGSAGWVALAILTTWACGCAAIVVLRSRMWWRIHRAVQMSTAIDIPSVVLPPNVQVRATPCLMEPGVVGFWRPIILLPAGIEEHLTPAQLEAVLAHELCHVRRRDNLTAAMHMLVEAVFWFHPLVWWIGARLVNERERACDEDVLRTLGEPRVYAEGILNVCKRYVDARLACVSGVSGSDLKTRIEAIMRNQRGEAVGAWKKLILATAGIAAVTAPIVMGSLGAPLVRAQSPRTADDPAFEAASIKPNNSGDARVTLMPQPGGRLIATNVTAAALIRFAYDLPDFQVSGGPNWLDSDRFDVLATAKGDPPVAQKRLMLRRLLKERFTLTAHTEMRVLPLYALVLARSDGKVGPRIRRTDADCARTFQPSSDSGVGLSPKDGPPRCGFFGFAPGTDFPSGRGGLAFRGLTMAALAKRLVPMVRRSVIDQTGLTGHFDADFDFIAELPIPPPPPGLPNPFGRAPFASVFTVFPEQLGLKLDARRGSAEVLVIDRADKPVEQ